LKSWPLSDIFSGYTAPASYYYY